MKTTFTIACLFFYFFLMAQPGTLDKSFGDRGIVLTDFDTNQDEARALLILPDNKILVAGTAIYTQPLGVKGRQCFSLAKYKEDGTPDSTFGKNGKVLSYFYHDNAQTNCIALQPDGKILVGGSMASDIPNTNDYFVLIRYKKNGRLDSSFGNNGLVSTLLPHNEGGSFHSILLQADSKIIGVGTSYIINENYAAIRYLPDGKLDSTFGVNGAVSTDVYWDYGNAGALQPDGKIIVGGSMQNQYQQQLMTIRYTANGQLDSSFGTNGKQIENFGLTGDIHIKAMQLLPNGKILLAGNYYSTTENDIIITRFNNNGSPDLTFASKGMHLNSFKVFSQCNAMTLQSDGKIMLAGEAFGNIISFGVARYKNNGEVDSSFGSYGAVQTVFSNASFANAIAIQPDKKIVAVGGIRECSYCEDFGVVRYNGDSFNNSIAYKIKNLPGSDAANKKIFKNLMIYPNPVQNTLYIEGLPSTKKNLTIVDVAGNIKFQAFTNATSYNLNIASLTAGNYLLKIETNNTVVTKQFLKK